MSLKASLLQSLRKHGLNKKIGASAPLYKDIMQGLTIDEHLALIKRKPDTFIKCLNLSLKQIKYLSSKGRDFYYNIEINFLGLEDQLEELEGDGYNDIGWIKIKDFLISKEFKEAFCDYVRKYILGNAFYKDDTRNFESLTLSFRTTDGMVEDPEKIKAFTKVNHIKADIVVKHTLREDKGYVDELVELMRSVEDHGLYICNNMIDWGYHDIECNEMQERYESFEMKPIINWIEENDPYLDNKNERISLPFNTAAGYFLNFISFGNLVEFGSGDESYETIGYFPFGFGFSCGYLERGIAEISTNYELSCNQNYKSSIDYELKQNEYSINAAKRLSEVFDLYRKHFSEWEKYSTTEFTERLLADIRLSCVCMRYEETFENSSDDEKVKEMSLNEGLESENGFGDFLHESRYIYLSEKLLNSKHWVLPENKKTYEDK